MPSSSRKKSSTTLTPITRASGSTAAQRVRASKTASLARSARTLSAGKELVVKFGLSPDELIVDNFAGGGGASCGIEQALGRPIDIAINHDEKALAMHRANHPHTLHLCENVFRVDIKKVCKGRPVGLAWFSPDCTHHSKARGGKPVSKNIRGLAWVVLKWAAEAKPRIICLENVEEFRWWGPLVEIEVTQPDGTVKRVKVPCKRRRGMTFKRWKTQLENLGYVVEFRELKACDYGAPTTRKRLFVIARCDGQPIVWPAETHAPAGDMFLQPYRTAADIIDFNAPAKSIFGRKKPLAAATCRRIALGVMRYVINNPQPFIINMSHGGSIHGIDQPVTTIATERGGCRAIVTPHIIRTAHGEIDRKGKKRGKGHHSIEEPLPTVTGSGDYALISPTLIQTGYGEREGQAPRALNLHKPLGTAVGSGKHALVAAFISQYNNNTVGSTMKTPVSTLTGTDKHAVAAVFLTQHNKRKGGKSNPGRPADKPLSTIMGSGSHQNLTAVFISKFRGTSIAQAAADPLHTISAGGNHFGEVQAFLIKYYGTDQKTDMRAPLPTVTSKDRMALVKVHGEDWFISDITLRMLSSRELFAAQGFPPDYIIAPDFGGKPLSKKEQVKMCGNSVSPACARAVVLAQFANAKSGEIRG